jgi:hypothetical protein
MEEALPDPVDSDVDLTALEERITALGDAIERCRKISLFAKIASAGGAIYLAAALVGFVAALPSTMIAAMAVILGGIVLMGSNASTWTNTESALAAARSAWHMAQIEDVDGVVVPFVRPTPQAFGKDRPTLH